jgi:hypothetical protein
MLDVVDNRENSLSQSADLATILEKIRSQPNGQSASAVSFSRPAEAIRIFYELIQSEQARQFMSERRDDNPVLRGLDEALSKHPLPPFSALESYLTPQGAIITNEESGIHSLTLTLRPTDPTDLPQK